MIEFAVETKGMDRAIKMVELTTPSQLAFILATALTETARDVEFIVKRAIQQDIDRPKPFTINSVTSTRATKQKLQASVLWRDAPAGTSGGKYLRPVAEGGSRDLKRSESALRKQGLLPMGYVLVPGEDAQLDQYGNVPGGVYTQMLSALKAFQQGTFGYVQNRSAKSAARKGLSLREWFVIKPGSVNRLAPGVYQRYGHSRKLIFAMVKDPHYNVIFPFEGITKRAAIERMPIQFELAVAKALKTARPES